MRLKTIPLREVLFAAKMGFLSKPLWEEFFARWSRSQNFRNWNKLIGDEYFRFHDSKVLRNVLVLAPRAIAELRSRGLLTVTPPHLGQFDHDTKVARIVLGLEKENVLDGFTTEGELKKKFMVWMKTSREGKSAKFPDLMLELQGAGKFKTIAIEVEQSLKSFDRYRQVMDSYANAKRVEAVVFVSDRQTIFNRLTRAMKETNYPSWERPVGFGELNEWLENPATATIHLNRGVSSIQQWVAGTK